MSLQNEENIINSNRNTKNINDENDDDYSTDEEFENSGKSHDIKNTKKNNINSNIHHLSPPLNSDSDYYSDFDNNTNINHNNNNLYNKNIYIQTHSHSIQNDYLISNKTILIKIDHLPPRKNWKQIKYLIGGIIHHSNILKVKLLPPLTSIMPPFLTFQSCIVTLKGTLSNEMINELLSTLNSYKWDYYDLFAYLIPPNYNYDFNLNNDNNHQNDIFPVPSYPTQVFNEDHRKSNKGNNIPAYFQQQHFPFIPSMIPTFPTPFQQQQQQQQQRMKFQDQGKSINSTENTHEDEYYDTNKTTRTNQSISTKKNNKSYTNKESVSPITPVSLPQSPNTPNLNTYGAYQPMVNDYPSYAMMTPIPPPPHPPHPSHPPPLMFPPIPQMTSTSAPSSNMTYPFMDQQQQQQQQHQEQQQQIYRRRYSYNQPNFSRYSRNNSLQFEPPMILPGGLTMTTNSILKRNTNPFKQPKKLRNIFNERNFRKQMTDRGMWQLKLTNFPPYLLPETQSPILNTNDNTNSAHDENIKIDIVTNSTEKFGKLRWTVLKDFIKLKCPKLLSLQGSPNLNTGNDNEDYNDKTNNTNVDLFNNTREFYVGVYEDRETNLIIKLENDSIIQMEAIIYNALIGFHDKELCDLCLKNLQDQEYSLGYKLKVVVVPPYSEEEEEREVNKQEFEENLIETTDILETNGLHLNGKSYKSKSEEILRDDSNDLYDSNEDQEEFEKHIEKLNIQEK